MKSKVSVAVVFAMLLSAASAYGEAATSFHNESSKKYIAVGSGCSKAVINKKKKAVREAKDTARANLVSACKTNYKSDSECNTYCTSNKYDRGWVGVWSSDVVYTEVNKDENAECGYWVKYKATSECGCICRVEW